MRFDKLAERQILKARASGALDNLRGAGKPPCRRMPGVTPPRPPAFA